MTRQPSNSQPPRWYITTAIPYVNARPHLGHALEFVLTDTLARYHWLKGEDIRFLSGTDENSFKNIQAAIWELIGVANKYVAEVKPWDLGRRCRRDRRRGPPGDRPLPPG